MKLAVLADIHSNWRALQAVAAHIEHWQPDRVVVGGDVINRGPRPAECLSFVLEKQQTAGWSVVLGNHEEYVLHHADPARPIIGPWAQIYSLSRWTFERLNGEVARVNLWPFQQSCIGPNGSEVRVVHASMRGTRDGIFLETSPDTLRRQIAPPPKVLVVGHTHRPFVRSVDETLVVNVGAVGLPFDGDPHPSYAQLTWHNDQWTAEIVRVDYDRAQANRDYDETGFIDEAGPLALLVRDELDKARSNLFEWTRAYETAVVSGQMGLAESVERFLAA